MTLMETHRWDPAMIIVNLNDDLYAVVEDSTRLGFLLWAAKHIPIRRQKMRRGRTTDRVTAYYLSDWNTEEG